MITKYYDITNAIINRGFITHEDQAVDLLRFSIYGTIIKVDNGSSFNVDSWASKHSLTVVEDSTAIAIINQFIEDSKEVIL